MTDAEIIEQILKLHHASALHLLADECEHRFDEDANRFDSADGDWLCSTCTTGEFMCEECTAEDAPEIVFHPCDTYKLASGTT